MKNWKKTMVLAMALCLLFAAGSGVFAIDLGNGFSLDGQLLTGVRADTKYQVRQMMRTRPPSI